MGALLAVRLVDEAAFFALPGAFETVRADLGLTYTQASALLVAPYLGAVPGASAGVLADRCSRRVLACTGALVEAAGLLTFAVAGGFVPLLAASLAIGFGATFLVDNVEVATVDVAGDRLESFLARQGVLASVGDLAGPALLLGAAALGVGWRATFLAVAALVAAYGAWLATLPLPGPTASTGDEGGGLRAVVRDPRVWLLALLGVFFDPLDEALLAFLVATLEVGGGWGPSAALLLGTSTIVGGLAGTIHGGRHPSAGRLGRPALATAVSTFALVAVGTGALVAVAGFASGWTTARLWLAFQVRSLTVRPGDVGAVQTFTSAFDLTGVVLPLGIGAVADAFGVTAGFATFAALALAALLVAGALDRRQ